MNNTGLIEVIIPTHNTPRELLEACFKSIINQNYTNFKAYIVEDGSSQENKDILDEIIASLEDERFYLIHHDGAGVSAARNVGIEKLSGDYIAFVDSDDALEPGIWEKAISTIQDNNCDAAVFGWCDDDGKKVVNRSVASQLDFVDYRDFQIRIAADNYDCGGGYPWNKIWKRQAIVSASNAVPKFDTDLNRYEDKLWCLQASQGLMKIALMPEIGYRYNYQETSLTHNESDLYNRMNMGYLAYEKMADFLQDRNYEAYVRNLTFQFITVCKDIKLLSRDKAKHADQLAKSHASQDKLCKRIQPGELRLSKFSFSYQIWRRKH